MIKVAIIVPVLGRPHRVEPFIESLQENTPEGEYSVLFIPDSNDHAEIAALDKVLSPSVRYLAMDPPVTWAQKINRGYQLTFEPFMFFVGDDVAFTPGWLEAALKAMQDPKIGVLGINDRANRRCMKGLLATHPFVRRTYIEQQSGVIDEPGKVVHEGYFLDFADDELTQTAMLREAFGYAKDSIVEHMHPVVGNHPNKPPDDNTYRMARVKFHESKDLFESRKHLWQK